MSKNVIVGIIAAVVIAAGGAGIYAMTRDDSASNQDNTDHSQHDANHAEFAPQSTLGQTFEATFSGGNDTTKTRSTMTKDAEDNFKLVTTAGGTNAEFYYVDEQYVSCNAGQCVKVPNSNNIDSSSRQYAYSDSDIEEFRKTAQHVGKVDCSSGSCDKWTADRGGVSTTFLIDDKGRINQASGKDGDTVFQVDFTYKDVPTITLPSNVTEIPVSLQDLQR
jgi:hypothetical protein